jgi:hypothetical protein
VEDGLVSKFTFNALILEASRLARENQRGELSNLIEKSLFLLENFTGEKPSFLFTLIATGEVRTFSENVAKSARSAGDVAEATRLEALFNDTNQIVFSWMNRRSAPDLDPDRHSGILARSAGGTGEQAPGIRLPTLSELEPGRMKWLFLAEQRALALAILLLSFFSLIALLASHFSSLTTRRLSARLLPILKLPCLLIFAISAWVIPLLLYFTITRFTPMGCLDWSLLHTTTLPFSSYWVTTVFVALTLATAIMGWRIRKTLAPLGFVEHSRWPHWLVFAISLVAFFSSGLVRILDDFDIATRLTGTILGIAVLYGMAFLILSFFHPRRDSVARVLTWRATAFTLATMALLSLLLLPVLIARETHWVEQETFCPVPGDPFHLSRLEKDFDEEMTKRLLKALEEAQQPAL